MAIETVPPGTTAMLAPTRELRVAIDVCLLPRVWGGVAHAAAALVQALGALPDGNESYRLVVNDDEQRSWIEPYVSARQTIVDWRSWTAEAASSRSTVGFNAKSLLVNGARRLKRWLSETDSPQRMPEFFAPSLPLSDGFIESLGCHVLHLPSQRFLLCALPTIYNPHDLQHLHYPHFFTPSELARRENIFPAGCHFAETVVVGTEWIKDDVVSRYRVDPRKVQIIPWAAPTIADDVPTAADIERVRNKYGLSEPFMLYPAAAWPHKNHIRLLEAIADLRDRVGERVTLICTGSLGDHYWVHYWPVIQERVNSLRLTDQVRFLGYVPQSDVRPLYRLALALIMPSLFEADSCPIHEAWIEGLPVASSNAAALPDQVGDAGLLFDPASVTSIAESMHALIKRPDLRKTLIERGHQRSRDFDWERTAKAYRAVYRRAARLPLSEEDTFLLTWDWMKTPQRNVPIMDSLDRAEDSTLQVSTLATPPSRL